MFDCAPPRPSFAWNSLTEVLTNARALVQRGWCKAALARGPDGSKTSWNDPAAVAWCAVGAVQRVSECTHWGPALTLLARAANTRTPVPIWNDEDHRTKKQVLAAFDRATELARAGEEQDVANQFFIGR
jgi:hypothetical protein